MKEKYTWYVEPILQTVNETISQELMEPHAAKNAYREKECADGDKRNLWECPKYSFITKLKKMYLERKDFKIYVQTGKGLPKLFSPKKE